VKRPPEVLHVGLGLSQLAQDPLLDGGERSGDGVPLGVAVHVEHQPAGRLVALMSALVRVAQLVLIRDQQVLVHGYPQGWSGGSRSLVAKHVLAVTLCDSLLLYVIEPLQSV
jgi:hypothetical protein